MYRFFALCCSLYLGVISSFAQSVASKSSDNNALLWKISGHGLKKPSYIFGTLHIICQSDYVWTDSMQTALKESQKVAMEMDMDDPNLQTEMASGMTLANGKTLKDFYTPKEYAELDTYATKNNIPLQMLQNFKPFALMSFVYSKVIPCMIPSSYEGNIMDVAHQQNKDIVGLESASEQISVMESMSEDSTAKSVLDMLVNLDSFKTQYNQMLSLYKTQSLPELYQLILESPDYKDDLNTLLFDRNAKWIPEIETLAKAQSTFIAVGAGHLWGDKGVISLLKKKGYTVMPVK
jgi:uncharacterized protein YbaP (TraB family)